MRSPSLEPVLRTFAREAVMQVVRQVLDDARDAIRKGAESIDTETAAARVIESVTTNWRSAPQPVLNGTGVILHTNLGRSPLSEESLAAMMRVGAYSDLEYDLPSGRRGSRQDHVRTMLCTLTGAESAHVVINTAAAVMLVLAATANRQEVIVSRGQAVEIGGGFRVPVILRQSGARLVEVGTTNRTRIADYEEAITDRTAAFLHVHSSNFRIVGFSEEVGLEELAALARSRGLLFIDDNGSGSLLDTTRFGLSHEPMPAESIRAGADIVTFSSDKLLGGPQGGIIVGRQDVVASIARHPLARAVRTDKFALAALSATLLTYLRGDAESTLPVWKMIGQSEERLACRARTWQNRARDRGLKVQTFPGESTVGGGSLPGQTLPTTLIALPGSLSASDLRQATTPVIARTRGGRVIIDLRTVPEDQDDELLDAILSVVSPGARSKVRMVDSGAQ